jgi:hypothetical protein
MISERGFTPGRALKIGCDGLFRMVLFPVKMRYEEPPSVKKERVKLAWDGFPWLPDRVEDIHE